MVIDLWFWNCRRLRRPEHVFIAVPDAPKPDLRWGLPLVVLGNVVATIAWTIVWLVIK
jgi:hypothetical protein